MFPLKTTTFPADAPDLARLLNKSLRDLFDLSSDPVELREISYPHLAELFASLDGAQLRAQPPSMPSLAANLVPALTIDSFRAKGSGMSVGPAVIDFLLAAQNLDLHRAPDAEGNIVLVPHRAGNGRIEVSVSPSDIETLVAEVAKSEAGKHGVTIEGVELTLRSNSPRSLAAEVRLRAKKLFLSASIRISGQVDLDDALVARISGLDCTGDGAFASIACGVLKSHLQKLDGREFPLMSLPLGEIRLRDVRIAAGDKLSVTAEFGAAT
jgi:hypothetical protein